MAASAVPTLLLAGSDLWHENFSGDADNTKARTFGNGFECGACGGDVDDKRSACPLQQDHD
jgi:hypothetical protein